MGYQEVEIEVIGHKGKVHTQYMNIDNINYYRPYIPNESEVGKNAKIQTMVYFKGSVKAIHINCSADLFQQKIKEIQGN
jgi:hypothetical protein